MDVGWLEKAEIKPTQPSWSWSWAELVNIEKVQVYMNYSENAEICLSHPLCEQ